MTTLLREHKISFPIRNPETTGASRSFVFAGTVDLFDPATGTVTDWKTIANPRQYITQKTISFQPELYALGLIEEGHSPKAVEYRLITRPTIRLKQRQTPFEYLHECVEWLRQEGKIVEHSLPLLPERIEAAKHFAWDIASDIVERRRNDRWHANESACWKFGTPCEFLKLCEAVAMGTDVGWLIEDRYEPRQYGKDYESEGGKDFLSYSAASCFTTCARQFFWRFERQLQAKHETAGEALRIGQLFHQGAEIQELDDLEKWLQGQEHVGTCGSPERLRKNQEMLAKVHAMLLISRERWS